MVLIRKFNGILLTMQDDEVFCKATLPFFVKPSLN